MNQKELIISWKKYLHANGAYRGDINSSDADPKFVLAIQTAENKLADALSNHAVRGLIWQKDRINPETPPEEFQAGLELIAKHFDKLKKIAQATLDALGPPEDQSDQPSATRFVPSKYETEIDTGNPDESQQIGRMVSKTPKKSPADEEIDKLLSELADLL